MSRLFVAVFPIAWALALGSFPAPAAQRAFVSSTGDDANGPAGCTLAAKCRSFQTAHNAVDEGGEIVALDTAGYGPVAISKSVTIVSSPGVIAGISVASGAGVTIATPDVSVILRGLNINNVGSGTFGIHMTDGASLAIENCVVSQFSSGAVVSAPARVKVVNSLMRGNALAGMQVEGGATVDVVGSQFLGNGSWGFLVLGGGATVASISDSVASDNPLGFHAGNSTAGAAVRMSCIRCTASNNTLAGFQILAGSGAITLMVVSYSKATFNGGPGLKNGGGGGISTLASQGNNTLYANAGGDTSGTITPLAGQ